MVNYGKLPQITTNLRHFWGKCYSKSWIAAGMRQPWILRWRADCFRTSEKAWKATSFARGGWLCRFSHPKKNAQKPCIFIPFHPQRRWYTMMKMWCFVAKVHQSLFVEGNRKIHGFSNAMFEILIKNEICEKGYAQFHPKFWPFDTTSRNLPNYLVRWCSMIFSVPCAFSMGFSQLAPMIFPLSHHYTISYHHFVA